MLPKKATIAAAGLAGLLLLVAIWQVLVTQANERKRSQPVVITHQDRGRLFSQEDGGWSVLAHATNEGEGAAYNVRWGVSFHGIRFAYRRDEEDPRGGNRFRVIHPREERAPEGFMGCPDLFGGNMGRRWGARGERLLLGTL